MIRDNDKKNILKRTVQAGLILILIILTFIMMSDIKRIQGNARVVNYAGIVRGATQRAVKLEISQNPNDDLISYLDEIFYGLINGGGKYELTKIDDKDYQDKLDKQYEYWKKLRKEITIVRQKGYKRTDIINMSEEYFNLADETVDAAERYSQHYATKMNILERVITAVIVLTVILLIKQSVDDVILVRKNKELKKKAYIDQHTGLPNKSRCEEIFMDMENLTQSTVVAVFDLNGLKQVNDTLGHIAGDTLIMNFANILRTSMPEKYFIGRYGGDEFVAVLRGADEQEMEEIIGQIQDSVDRYNSFSKQMHLEFAHGYAVSSSYPESNLKILLEKADKKMYLRKAEMKAVR